MSSEELGTYEMLWDCTFCGQKKLLGLSQRHCPNCGGEQDPNKRYFPSDADKVAVKDHPFVGADLVCPFCKSPQSAKAKCCTTCGGELKGNKQAALRSEQVVGEGQQFGAESLADAKRDFGAQKGPKAPVPPPAKKLPTWVWIAGIAAVVVAAIVFVVVWKKPQAVVVTSHAWTRSILVEQFGPVSESEWCDHMPFDARMVFRHREVRSHDKVQDGETCTRRRVDKGNGTFSERKECSPKYKDVPVYGDKCNYTVDRWRRVSPITASGDLAQAPAWPQANLRGGTCLGCQREAGREEKYTVGLKRDKDGKVMECDLAADKWSGMKEGSKWKVDVGVITGLPKCESLQAL